MTLGVIMLAHSNVARTAQVVRHWSAAKCPVVVHFDARSPDAEFEQLRQDLADCADLRFSERLPCVWGMWGLVEATLGAVRTMLEQFPDVERVLLTSGSCLPLRPIDDLRAYLDEYQGVDFIESVAAIDVAWAVGGLDRERFSLYFPFSWRDRRAAFDRFVRLQRLLRVNRKLPEGLSPHLGSQWWCLTRSTLQQFLDDPNAARYQRYFARTWVPDESYFQTLVRRYSTQIESRSLTYSKFDFLGKPHVFYDDHGDMLEESGCFMARKIWERADGLYARFLNRPAQAVSVAEPRPYALDRMFGQAAERRLRGRRGLYNQGAFAGDRNAHGLSSTNYSVFWGFRPIYPDFEAWLENRARVISHGYLFDPEGAEFHGRKQVVSGGLVTAPKLRDYAPERFLCNLLWSAPDTRHAFQIGPDCTQRVMSMIGADENAQVSVITGAWAITLFQRDVEFHEKWKLAAQAQNTEKEMIEKLMRRTNRATIRIWTLADFLQSPIAPMRTVLQEIGGTPPRSRAALPKEVDLKGFGAFLQKLRNEGMNPHTVGDISYFRDY